MTSLCALIEKVKTNDIKKDRATNLPNELSESYFILSMLMSYIHNMIALK